MSAFRMNLFWLLMFAGTLPLAVVLSTWLAGRSFQQVRLGGQTVTVKGYAEHPITSDLAMWSARIVERDKDRTVAYGNLDKRRALLLTFLNDRGFDGAKVEFGPVDIEPEHARNEKGYPTGEITGYRLSQQFAIESRDVGMIADIARDAGGLIGQGVELQAGAPTYLYTKLDEMKLEMLSRATANARERAERLVDGSGSGLGGLRSASQGVFQVTSAYSTDVSAMGYNDTSSIEKSIKAVVTVEYAIE